MPAETLFFVILITLVIGITMFSYGRAHAILDSWAAQNGYEILERRQAWFSKGPFFWNSTKNQVVFRVVVRDRHGAVRRGWVRVGHWFFGVLSDHATESWEY